LVRLLLGQDESPRFVQCPVACDNGACYNIFMNDESDVDLEALKNLRSSDDDADSEELLACGD
jgi:hypothetical protein